MSNGVGDGWCPFATRRPLTVQNYETGRRGFHVRAVCLHIAEGPLTAVYPTFNNPDRQASAHFCVGKQGEIEQYVSINDTAWANGLHWDDSDGGHWLNPRDVPVNPSWRGLIRAQNPNLYTISIEHEGFFQENWTAAMYAANLKLLQWIRGQLSHAPLGVAAFHYVRSDTLIGHFEIDPVDRPNCPGPNVEWDRMVNDLNASDVSRAALIAGANKFGIPLNDQAALAKYAIKNRLGIPLTDEFPFTVQGVRYVGQVWSQAILYVKFGDWDNVQVA